MLDAIRAALYSESWSIAITKLDTMHKNFLDTSTTEKLALEGPSSDATNRIVFEEGGIFNLAPKHWRLELLIDQLEKLVFNTKTNTKFPIKNRPDRLNIVA